MSSATPAGGQSSLIFPGPRCALEPDCTGGLALPAHSESPSPPLHGVPPAPQSLTPLV